MLNGQWRTSIRAFRACPVPTFGFGTSIQSAERGDMTAFDANVNQHAANTSPRNLVVQLCMQIKRHISQLQICGAHLPSISNKHAPLSAPVCTFDKSWVGS